jgi:glycosyltransferase involved in cell wall biosynthesis
MNCHNGERYLRESIESVVSQSYKDWELIFWDNQSTDNSAEIIKSYSDKRIKYYYAKNFTKLGAARNLAIDRCSGDWIAFLDSDDIWDKKKLEIFTDIINKCKNRLALIYSKTLIIDCNGNIVDKADTIYSGRIRNKLLELGDFIVFSSILVNKAELLNVGKVDSSLNYCEDYDILLKITEQNNSVGVQQYLTYYRKHQHNATTTSFIKNNIEVLGYLFLYIYNKNIPTYTRIRVVILMLLRVITLIPKYLLKALYTKSCIKK